MQQNLPPEAIQAPTLGTRLAECAGKLGGKRALAKAAGMSEAQLFRYINGDCDIAVSKLQALANAAQVAPEWLLTGTPIVAPPARPEFNPALLRQITQTVEEYLYEYPITFSPKHRAELIALAYESLRHGQAVYNFAPNLTREGVFNLLDFAAGLKRSDEISLYHNLMLKAEIEKSPLSTQEQLTLERLVKLGWDSIYNGISGQLYFSRVGHTLEPAALQNLLEIVSHVTKNKPGQQINWLDLGCGNGRHLLPLVQHAPHLKLHGVERSNVALQELSLFMRNGRLPDNSIEQSDMAHLPYAAESFDVIYSRYVLYFTPLVEDKTAGIKAVMSEMARVLKPNGHAVIILPDDKGCQWMPFLQFITHEELMALAAEAGLTCTSHKQKQTAMHYNFKHESNDYTPSIPDVTGTYIFTK